MARQGAERLHDLLVDVVGVEVQQGLCDLMAEDLLKDYVPAERAEERFEEGKRVILERTYAVEPAVLALTEAKDLLRNAVAWQGPEEWRDEQIDRIDELIRRLEA